FEQEQLQRLNRVEAVGRDAVVDRVEGDVLEEAAPLGDDLVAGARVGVVVEPPIPVRDGHLGDGVDLVEDVVPERRRVAGARVERRHPDDGDVARGAGRLRLGDGRQVQLDAGEKVAAPTGDVVV